MSIKLFNGLINLGGILTETYYRKTRATSDAKAELGLDPAKDYNSSIGIASVEEYVILSKNSTAANATHTFNLAPFDQPFRIASVQTYGMDTDQFSFTINNASNAPIYRRVINKNLAFYPIENIFVPTGGSIVITPSTPLGSITISLKPCMVIADSIPVPPVTP